MNGTTRFSLRLVSLATCGSLAFATVAVPSAVAAAPATASTATTQVDVPPLTEEQRSFIELTMGDRAISTMQDRMAADRGGKDVVTPQAFPIAAVAIAAAAWCARGALASVPTSALSDIINGRYSGWRTYVTNAVIGCLVGEVGGWVWRVLPGWVKTQAVNMVVSFIIRYIR
jgi:hypothetical protein